MEGKGLVDATIFSPQKKPASASGKTGQPSWLLFAKPPERSKEIKKAPPNCQALNSPFPLRRLKFSFPVPIVDDCTARTLISETNPDTPERCGWSNKEGSPTRLMLL